MTRGEYLLPKTRSELTKDDIKYILEIVLSKYANIQLWVDSAVDLYDATKPKNAYIVSDVLVSKNDIDIIYPLFVDEDSDTFEELYCPNIQTISRGIDTQISDIALFVNNAECVWSEGKWVYAK